MTRELILEAWLSEQIDPAEMLRLCAADPEVTVSFNTLSAERSDIF